MPNDKKDKAQEMNALGRDVDTLGRDVDRLMLQQKNAIEKITGVMDACKKESLLEGVSDDELASLEAYCSDMMNAVTVARKLVANLIEAYKSKVPKLDIAKKIEEDRKAVHEEAKKPKKAKKAPEPEPEPEPEETAEDDLEDFFDL